MCGFEGRCQNPCNNEYEESVARNNDSCKRFGGIVFGIGWIMLVEPE